MKKTTVLIIILTLFVFHTAVNYRVLSLSRFFPEYDEGSRVIEGLSCHQNMNFSDIKTIKRELSCGLGQGHPPLLKLIHAFCWWFLGIFNSAGLKSVIISSNALFFFILLGSVYGIGSLFYGRNAGVLSAFLISMFPVVFGQSRSAMLDFPLTCMVSLAVYLILKTKRFSSLIYSLSAGVAVGLAGFTKETAVIFIFPPLFYYLFLSVPFEESRRRFRNFSLFLLAFAAIIGVLYLPPLLNSYPFSRYAEVTMNIRHSPGFLWYFVRFPLIAGWLLFAACLPLFLSYLMNIRGRERFFLFWFIIPFILFSLSDNKALRFILPLAVPFSIIVSQELFSNRLFKKAKAWITGMLVIAAISQYVLLNSGLAKVRDSSFERAERLNVYQDAAYPAYAAVFDIFKKEAAQSNPKIKRRAVFLFDSGEFSCYLAFNLLLYRLPLDEWSPVTDLLDVKRIMTMEQLWTRQFDAADYIVDSDAIRYKDSSTYFLEERIRGLFNASKEQFKTIGTVELKDGSHIYIYKRLRDVRMFQGT